MQPITGIFNHFTDAARASGQLQSVLNEKQICLLTPESPPERVLDVPKTEDMPPVGGAMGATVGGALGVGLAVALPGVGPIAALGTAAAALLLGAGGAAAGWKLGDAADRAGWTGVPVDELYVYEDALRTGRSVLIAFVDDKEKEDGVRAIMEQNDAESVDAARERWWLGLRDAEEASYDVHGADFREDEESYRKGMEAALSPALRGKTFEEAEPMLRTRAPDDFDKRAFRRGFARGQSYWRAQLAADNEAKGDGRGARCEEGDSLPRGEL
jgi:hypothetical protein